MKSLVYYLKVDTMNLKIALRIGLISLLLIFVLAACKKDEPEEIEPDSTAIQQLSSDDKSVEESTDEVLDDAGEVLAGSRDNPCNASLDSITIHNDTLIFFMHYHGLNCDQSRHRTGFVWIKLKLNTQWHQKGAYLVIEFKNYVVRNMINNHQIRINGSSIVENVSGGNIAMVGQGIPHLIHKSEASLKVAFNGHPMSTWNLTKRLIYSGMQGKLLMSIEGYGVAQGHKNLVSWGHDRDGKVFFTEIEQAVVHSQECFWLPVAGKQVYDIPSDHLSATVEYGYNNNNQPINPGECPAKYKLVWQQQGHSGTIFIPLF